MSVLAVRDLTQTFSSGGRPLTVLDGVSFQIADQTTCAIVGPSGSGKTTLLGLCAGLDRPTSGEVILCDRPLEPLNEDARATLRRDHVGFVFQQFRLIATLTAQENVEVPLSLAGVSSAKAAREAAGILDRVGLGDRLSHYPSQLSGGEQQRVAIARAFIHRPRILFADEPTGNLDADTGRSVEDLLFSLNREAGTTLVVVTHDADLAARTDRVLRLRGGRLLPEPVAIDEAPSLTGT